MHGKPLANHGTGFLSISNLRLKNPIHYPNSLVTFLKDLIRAARGEGGAGGAISTPGFPLSDANFISCFMGFTSLIT